VAHSSTRGCILWAVILLVNGANIIMMLPLLRVPDFSPEQPQAKAVSPVPTAPEAPSSPEAKAAWEKIQPHLKAAEEEVDTALSKACDRIYTFFDDRRMRCRAFAEHVLGLRGKWEYLKSIFTPEDGHRHFLHEAFEEKVFSHRELADCLKSVLEEYLEALKGIDNRLLIAIRADLEDSPLPGLHDASWLKANDTFLQHFSVALNSVRKATSLDLQVQAGSFAVSGISADVAAQLLTPIFLSVAGRLGVSASITGNGLVVGAASLGLGIVAGLVIDMFLDYLLQVIGYDPVTDIEDDMDLYLDLFRGVLVFGDDFEEDRPRVRLSANPFPDSSDVKRTDRINEKHIELWEQRRERIKHSNKACEGLCSCMDDIYEQKAKIRDAAILNLIKGGN